MRFSVCIPTFHRPQGLIRALESFQRQTYRGRFEIIVCDNDSDPAVEKLVRDFNITARVPAAYFGQGGGIQEVRSRLAHEARGELVLMIDDDESACPGLLEAYDRLLTRNGDVVAAGGPCRVIWEDPPPAWVESYVQDRTASNLWGRYEPYEELTIGVGVSIWGGNMVFRRPVFEFTGFRPDIYQGRNRGDGESGLIAELAVRNLKTAFVPQAAVLHFMDRSRYNLRYVRRTASYLGAPFAYRRWHQANKSLGLYASEACKIGAQYYKTWLHYAYRRLFGTKITSRRIGVEFRAHVGFFQLRYILWLMRDPAFRGACDQSDFRPEVCLRAYQESLRAEGERP
jgi:glycosyltransferase involved in cell wall biosynthesis